MAHAKLGELLLKAGVINEVQLKGALAEQQRWGGKLGDILIRMEFVSEEIIVNALSQQLGMTPVNLDVLKTLPPDVTAKVPLEMARDIVVVPLQLRDDGKTLVVAMAEPQNLEQFDTLRAVTKCKIVPALAGKAAILRALARFYEGEAELNDLDGGSFKVVDAQGNTMMKDVSELRAQLRPPPQNASYSAPPPAPAPAPQAPRPAAPGAPSPSDQIKALEEAQRKEVAALKAMVEILIEKGVFTREEYIAKVKR